ncbi:MAG TPA: phosphoadenylyl-sulfate reductase [Blastocatellia bacterium]|nr:phosphoadenylyl-sulfate reductase [Blastocatellia bacterium]
MALPKSELVQLEYTPLNRADALAERLEAATPEEILFAAFDEFGDRVAIATGFGAEGAALIDMAVKINPHPNIFFLDTGFLFPETYELRRRMEARYRIEIRAVRTAITPESQDEMFGPRLWSRDPDLCCRLRKLEPLKEALKDLDAWITAIRRDQTEARATARAAEWDYRWQRVKINPLVGWTKRDVWDYIARHDVPYNPLHDAGYPSIGCTHCTRAVGPGEAERAGRWAGRAKTECGLHGQEPKVVPLKLQL